MIEWLPAGVKLCSEVSDENMNTINNHNGITMARTKEVTNRIII